MLLALKQGTSQNWVSVPCFSASAMVNGMFMDSLHNEINLLFNNSHSVCSSYFKGVIAYNGQYFHDLDVGFQTHDGNLNSNIIPNTSITFSNKTLYGGQFNSVGSNTLFSQSMALWDGIKWDTFPKKPFPYNPNKNNPIVTGFLNDGGKLWIAGAFDTIGGVKVQNLCTFDGVSYTPLNIPTTTNAVVSKLIRYKDGIYISGLFYDLPSFNNSRIIKYNDNNTWSSVANGIQGFAGNIGDMVVYNDTLYVAGAFSTADGNTGNYIMKWDGSQFYDAGFGNFYDWGGISKLLIFKNRLYAFGSFKYSAGQKAYGAAYYENGTWTVNKDSLNNGINGAVIFNNEIYIAGAFTSIKDSPIKYFAKLRCPDFTECYEPYTPITVINIYPNPANTEINITVSDDFKYNSRLTIFNDIGQLIFQTSIKDSIIKISCESWAKGLYLISFHNQQKTQSIKILKE